MNHPTCTAKARPTGAARLRAAHCFNWLASLALACLSTTAQAETAPALRGALVFHASFDGGLEADFGRGDRRLFHATSIEKRGEATAGLPAGGEAEFKPGAGRFGGALRFNKSKSPLLFFKADKNIPLPAPDWSGTVSFWLSTDPAGELAEGFCDPIQLTSKQWDDAAFFVEFEKRPAGIPFRLGVYADKAVWNPKGLKWEEIPAAQKPLAAVEQPPFSKGKWTHVAFVFSKFNTGQPNGLATLYLDGKKAGEISPRTQTFTWDPARAVIMLGVSYVGLMDDLAVFNRALTADEIGQVHALPGGAGDLTAKKP